MDALYVLTREDLKGKHHLEAVEAEAVDQEEDSMLPETRK
jgi:hypothetical protein